MKQFMYYKTQWNHNSVILFCIVQSSFEKEYYDCYNAINGFSKKPIIKKLYLLWV